MFYLFLSPKFTCWNPNPRSDGIGDGFGRSWGYEGRALTKRAPARSFSPSGTWGYRGKMAVCWGSRPVPDTQCAGTLLLGSPVSSTVGKTFLWFLSRPICGILFRSLNGLRQLSGQGRTGTRGLQPGLSSENHKSHVVGRWTLILDLCLFLYINVQIQ